MQRSLRVLAGAIIVLNVVAIALTLVRRPTGPTGPDGEWTLFDCSLWLILTQLVIGAGYAACMLYCERHYPEGEDQNRCAHQCLRWYLWAQAVSILGYLVCITSLFF
jgi:hypothetical protein